MIFALLQLPATFAVYYPYDSVMISFAATIRLETGAPVLQLDCKGLFPL